MPGEKAFMSDRQHKIEQNKKRIDELTTIIKHDEEYNRYRNLTERSKKVLRLIEKETKEIEEKIQHHRDKEWIRRKGDLIQNFANSIEEKEEKIRIINIMIQSSQKKRKFTIFSTFKNRSQQKKKSNSKISNLKTKILEKIKTSNIYIFRSTWKSYYTQKKETNSKESHKPTMRIEEFIRFTEIYNSIMKKQEKTFNSNLELKDNLKHMLAFYRNKQEKLINDKNTVEEELDKVVRFWPADYYKAKKELEETKLMIEESFPIVQQHFNILAAKRKAQIEEIRALEKENNAYEAQIINFRRPSQTSQQKSMQYVKKVG